MLQVVSRVLVFPVSGQSQQGQPSIKPTASDYDVAIRLGEEMCLKISRGLACLPDAHTYTWTE